MSARRAATPDADLKVLLLADSHLGFDLPVRPRVRRRRRGHDFLANYQRVCRTAIDEGVDLVVHGGDVFHKPTAPASLVYQAFDPLKEIADAGIPVFVVPGNHERSRIPFDWLGRHPRVHVFEEAGTVRLKASGRVVTVTGIPCIRRDARSRFASELSRTGWSTDDADMRLLVTHQAFEGAVVGPVDFTFRTGDDVVKLSDVPEGIAAVLSGHIHRSQVLRNDLRGRPCPAPVFYPGSLERTAFAERDEPKGFMVLSVAPGAGGGTVGSWTFHDIGARPMEIRPLRVRDLTQEQLEEELRTTIAAAPPDAVLRLEADGPPSPGSERILAAGHLRSLTPESMNLDVIVPGARRWVGRSRATRGGSSGRAGDGATPPSEQGDLFEEPQR